MGPEIDDAYVAAQSAKNAATLACESGRAYRRRVGALQKWVGHGSLRPAGLQTKPGSAPASLSQLPAPPALELQLSAQSTRICLLHAFACARPRARPKRHEEEIVEKGGNERTSRTELMLM